MKTSELKRYLRSLGIIVTPMGATGHLSLLNPGNGRRSVMPSHGSRKELATGTVHKILKDLGLK
ncbi:hypothetical protein VZ95_14285 [Elstera litoralis]|uniref:Periplasmic or secreted lipoprotein n=1 Tax=Elstera litoralis TaxID=552518 RepID=A0A0F3ITP3_9PROT|nr:type II toxin-antitoxin system HicA family toxin [Elstera litoralis]KJV08984.1 hypothetical protein VZ95_14285 [Elstera litoralis]